MLAACSAGSDATPDAAGDDGRIACALDGAQQFARVCDVERLRRAGTLYLIVRHPDGGFRRFERLNDGRGLALADGADQAQVIMAGDVLDVAVGADRYRFPATRMDHAATP